MSWLIEDQGHYLQLLQSTSTLRRKALLTTITKPQLKALCEITHNVLKGTVELSPSEKKTLKRYKKILTLLGEKKSTRREKLKALQSASTWTFFFYWILLELHYGQDDFDFFRKVQESDIQADFKGTERNGIPNDKQKKIRTSGNSRKKKRMESVTGYHFKNGKKNEKNKKSKKEKKTDKQGELKPPTWRCSRAKVLNQISDLEVWEIFPILLCNKLILDET